MAEQIDEERKPTASSSLWAQNHGNLLLSLVAGIFLLGAALIFYGQNRMRKPGFPSGDAITQVGANGDQEVRRKAAKEVSIVVIGAANTNGSVRVAIYDSIESFNDVSKAYLKEALPITDGQAVLKIPRSSLPDSFAVATYHDENDDGELNRNRIGVPTERYGFSLNARGFTGPPPFNEAEVKRSTLQNSLEISIR